MHTLHCLLRTCALCWCAAVAPETAARRRQQVLVNGRWVTVTGDDTETEGDNQSCDPIQAFKGDRAVTKDNKFMDEFCLDPSRVM